MVLFRKNGEIVTEMERPPLTLWSDLPFPRGILAASSFSRDDTYSIYKL